MDVRMSWEIEGKHRQTYRHDIPVDLEILGFATPWPDAICRSAVAWFFKSRPGASGDGRDKH